MVPLVRQGASGGMSARPRLLLLTLTLTLTATLTHTQRAERISSFLAHTTIAYKIHGPRKPAEYASELAHPDGLTMSLEPDCDLSHDLDLGLHHNQVWWRSPCAECVARPS